MRNKTTILILAATALAVAVHACSGHSSGAQTRGLRGLDSLPPDIQNLVRAVAANDTDAFAAAVSYPLPRPYPLRDIATDTAMRRYYALIMDDTLQRVMTDDPGASWVDCGWRGWSAGDGNYLWYDDGIYAIPYLSAREKALRDSLVRREMASLYKPMRQGWQPVACYRGADTDSIFRIDSRQIAGKVPQFRLAAYASPAVMRDRPAWEINGYRTIDGSAMIETYTFECRDARGGAVTTVTFSPDLPNAGDGIGLRIERQGQPERTLYIVPAYWLDMLPPQPR